MKIGKKIRKVRELRDYTQTYMASQLNLCPSAYHKVEKDLTDLTWSRLVRIAELLDVTPAQLVAFDSDKPFVSVQELTDSLLTQTVGGAAGLPDRERRLYEGQIELLKQQVELLHSLKR